MTTFWTGVLVGACGLQVGWLAMGAVLLMAALKPPRKVE